MNRLGQGLSPGSYCDLGSLAGEGRPSSVLVCFIPLVGCSGRRHRVTSVYGEQVPESEIRRFDGLGGHDDVGSNYAIPGR